MSIAAIRIGKYSQNRWKVIRCSLMEDTARWIVVRNDTGGDSNYLGRSEEKKRPRE